MEWEKAKPLLRNYPKLEWLLDSKTKVFNPKSPANPHRRMSLRRWIERKVEYIAFRPIERLDFAMKHGYKTISGFNSDEIQIARTIFLDRQHMGGNEHCLRLSVSRSIREEIVWETWFPYQVWRPEMVRFYMVVIENEIASKRFGPLHATYDVYCFPSDWKPEVLR